MDAINTAAQVWYRYMTSAAVQATLLALVLLGIVWAGRRLSPALRHAVLMIALLKFVIPPTLPLPTGLFSQIKPEVSSKSAPPIRHIAPVVEDALWLSVSSREQPIVKLFCWRHGWPPETHWPERP